MMLPNWLDPHVVEQARARHSVLMQAAAHQRLLRQLPPTARWMLLRTLVLCIGNALIATGAWLKQRAAPTERNRQLPTMAGRFS